MTRVIETEDHEMKDQPRSWKDGEVFIHCYYHYNTFSIPSVASIASLLHASQINLSSNGNWTQEYTSAEAHKSADKAEPTVSH